MAQKKYYAKDVVYRPKSPLQKDNCINPKCKNVATLEATVNVSFIRCCASAQCKLLAAQIALSGANGFSPSFP